MLEPKSQNKYMFTGCKTESQEKKDEKHLDCHSFFPFSLSLDIYMCVCVFKALKYSESPHFPSALKSYLIVLGQAALTKHVP